jgi:hypothetical protein
LVSPTSTNKLGKITPNGETLKKLNAMLPQVHKAMRAIPNTKTVYLAGSAADANASKTQITGIKANALWDARDAIALTPPISLFRLKIERVHLQSYDPSNVSSSRSLATLLNLVGTMKWKARYKSDLGGKKQLFSVGSAKQI